MQLNKARQVLRAMQLSGKDVDVQWYREYVDAELGDGAADEQTSVALERFKFWLGMPNRYYGS